MNSHERRKRRRQRTVIREATTYSQQSSKELKSKSKQQKRNIPRAAWAVLWAVIGGGATLLSYLGILQLKPSISVEPYASQDPHKPFSEQFYLQNTSVYAIQQIEPLCGVVNVQAGNLSMRDFSVVNLLDFRGRLEPGAKTTVTCVLDRLFGDSPTKYGALDIVVWERFKIPFGISECKASYFRGIQAADQTYIWTFQGMQDCPWGTRPGAGGI